MSILHVRHIENELAERFEGSLDVSDLAKRPEKERHQAFLSRALAAFAVARITGVDDVEAACSVTDGFGDNGLDALYIDVEGHQTVVVQSKWDGTGKKSPDLGSVEKFLTGFEDLIHPRLDRFNEKIQQRKGEIEDALRDPDMRFELVVAHTGQQSLSEIAKERFGDLLAELNDPVELVRYRELAQEGLWAFVSGQYDAMSIDADLTLHEWSLVDQPFSAYAGLIDSASVAQLWQAYGTRLFRMNLRSLIPHSDANSSMTETLLAAPERFWYFNNGITALCDRIQKKPQGGADRAFGMFRCQGLTIVNGAQTVGTIGTTFSQNPELVGRARVGIRLISLEDCPEGFSTEVTRATNTQNRIERRDFVSLDPEQDRLRRELRVENGKTYVFKTGESVPDEEGCDVAQATVALACSDRDPALAVLAKRELGRLWDDIGRAPYKRLFNPQLSALRMWRSVEVLRSVDETLRARYGDLDGRAELVAVHGNRLLLHRVFRALQPADLEDLTSDFGSILAGVPATANEVLERLVALVEQEYAGSYPASLFKNGPKCKRLCEMLEGREPPVEPSDTRPRTSDNGPAQSTLFS